MWHLKLYTRWYYLSNEYFVVLLWHASDMIFDGKEQGPFADIAGAKLSTPKNFWLWLLFCVVSAVLSFAFWLSFFLTLRSYTTSNLTPWCSNQQQLLSMCWTSMNSYCSDLFRWRDPLPTLCQAAVGQNKIDLIEIPTHYYDTHWNRFPRLKWQYIRSPNSWTTLPRSSFSSFRSLWTVNKTDLLTGIFQISQKLFIDHFLTYKFSPTNLWRTVQKNTTTSEPAPWTSWPPHPQTMTTNYYSLRFKNYIADVHRQKDLPVPHSLNGYGKNIKNPCGDNPLTSAPYKLSLTLRNFEPGSQSEDLRSEISSKKPILISTGIAGAKLSTPSPTELF